MICKSCVVSGRPNCGFALAETGDRVMFPAAAMLVAIGESGDRIHRQGPNEQERAAGWTGPYTDPHRPANPGTVIPAIYAAIAADGHSEDADAFLDSLCRLWLARRAHDTLIR